MYICKIISKIIRINWLKTIVFNFHYFPFRSAIRFPAFVFRHTKLEKMGGKISVFGPITSGMLAIGPRNSGTIDGFYERTIWHVEGGVKLTGQCVVGRGSRISIGPKGILTFGSNFKITCRSTIICHKGVSFGDDCLLSWDILIMDTDFHRIVRGDKVINEPSCVEIGNHVWVGCKTTILKGVSICDDVVIAANSTVTRNVEIPKSIYGGSGKSFTPLLDNIEWFDK